MRLGVTTSPAGGGVRLALAQADGDDGDRDDGDRREHDDADLWGRDRTGSGPRPRAAAAAGSVAALRPPPRRPIRRDRLVDLAGQVRRHADRSGRRRGRIDGLGEGRVRPVRRREVAKAVRPHPVPQRAGRAGDDEGRARLRQLALDRPDRLGAVRSRSTTA